MISRQRRVGAVRRGIVVVPWALALLFCVVSLSIITIQIYMAVQINQLNEEDPPLSSSHKHPSAAHLASPISPGLRLKLQQIKQTMHEYAISAPNSVEVYPEEKAVLVMMSYLRQRSRNTDMLLWAYSQMPGVLSKIIFVWNNPDEDPPDLYDYGEVPIVTFLTKTNHLTDRFLAPTQLATRSEAVLLVDDDVFLTAGLIGTMLQKWHGCDKLCLVGLDPRYVDPTKRQYTWKGGPGSNLAITKTMMATNSLLNDYLKHDVLVERAKIPSNACEDISFSLFAVNYTRVLPAFVAGEKRGSPDVTKPQLFYRDLDKTTLAGMRYDLPEDGGLSTVKGKRDKAKNDAEWKKKRDICVKYSFDYIGEGLVAFLKTV